MYYRRCRFAEDEIAEKLAARRKELEEAVISEAARDRCCPEAHSRNCLIFAQKDHLCSLSFAEPTVASVC